MGSFFKIRANDLPFSKRRRAKRKNNKKEPVGSSRLLASDESASWQLKGRRLCQVAESIEKNRLNDFALTVFSTLCLISRFGRPALVDKLG